MKKSPVGKNQEKCIVHDIKKKNGSNFKQKHLCLYCIFIYKEYSKKNKCLSKDFSGFFFDNETIQKTKQ